MTDDQILAEAEKIMKKRLQAARLAGFFKKDTVMIRWDNPGAPFGESYSSVTVAAEDVADVVSKALGGVS